MNPYLTPAMHRALSEIKSGDKDIVCSRPGGWWIDERQIHGSTALKLLRLCLISPDAFNSEDFEHFHINEDGIKALESEDYVPAIIRAFKNPQTRRFWKPK